MDKQRFPMRKNKQVRVKIWDVFSTLTHDALNQLVDMLSMNGGGCEATSDLHNVHKAYWMRVFWHLHWNLRFVAEIFFCCYRWTLRSNHENVPVIMWLRCRVSRSHISILCTKMMDESWLRFVRRVVWAVRKIFATNFRCVFKKRISYLITLFNVFPMYQDKSNHGVGITADIWMQQL